jgi:hypothetical protein
MRLYNPKNGSTFTTASDDEAHVAVYLEAGWVPAPEPVVRPGYQPEPVVYAPVPQAEPEEAAKPKRARSTKDEPSE